MDRNTPTNRRQNKIELTKTIIIHQFFFINNSFY
jgi:hypothetical protein